MQSKDMTQADLDLIQRIIPHRYPFLLVDKMKDIDPGKSAVGVKNVTINEPHFQGHFPGAPIMPGVMIIEAMAQSAAVLVGLWLEMVDKPLLVYFMSVDNGKFRQKVVPGDVLELHVTVVKARGMIWKFHGDAKVDGKIVAEADFTAMIDLQGEG
ncbi:3-hydroxyacyl-ACP dehydratase FabZ [Falsihalocynthiibacter sp. S25ZX9]|uniref:3-hydroxyacyl-ACP dehydratase FabZ n=1 Tax=Falsihalocynthiibacter sp. S25ZX9 TaxID=3240870 RepID=UPI00350E9263